MSPDAVFLAWGRPSGVFQGSKNGQLTERWDYASTRPVQVSNFYGSYSYGYGGYGITAARVFRRRLRRRPGNRYIPTASARSGSSTTGWIMGAGKITGNPASLLAFPKIAATFAPVPATMNSKHLSHSSSR